MGKNVAQQESVLFHHHRPKCLWGIFHHLNHYRWNTVKKRLPYRKRASSNGAVAGDPEKKATPAVELQEKADTQPEKTPVEAMKPADSGSASKSMKSRLKALLFTDEGSKRRGWGRHRRSSSCPTTEKTAPDAMAADPAPEASLTANTSEHHAIVHTSLASLLDPPLPTIFDGQVTSKHECGVCVAILKMNYLKQSEMGMHGLQGFEDHTLVQKRLMYALEPTKAASLQESKLFLKALDLLNVRKEVVLKILHDPSSSLAHQLHDGQASKLDKSMTFPAPGSLRRRDVKCTAHENLEENLFTNHSVKSTEMRRDKHGVKKKMCTDPELLDNVAKHSPSEQKSRGSRYGLWNFKNLRDKLKYAIKESKKEKHRIVMDAVLDKIPRGRRMPKDVKEAGSPHLNSPFGKTENMQCMKRAKSFHESAERYNQLLESCFHRETQHRVSDEQPDYRASGTPTPATTSPRTLERFMSLPDLRCYSSSRSEDSQFDTSSVRTTTGNNLNAENSRYGERKLMHTPTTGSEYHTLSEPNSDEILQDGFQDVGDAFDGNIIEPTTSSTTLNSVPEVNLQDTTCTPKVSAAEGDSLAGQPNEMKTETCSSVAADSGVDAAEKEGSPLTGLNILMDLHVDNKNKAQFDYVKDVIELSGFSGIEFLDSWHSAELPLNPSVFEEVEGCLLSQPDCTGNEAGGTCDHLLLFDLINEVLLEMYERSFSYWPQPLTCHSWIRRMPVGYRVLEEVWANINWLLSWSHEHEGSVIEDAVSDDLSKGNSWMNLQFDAECAGLELEELIMDDLLDELIYDDLLF